MICRSVIKRYAILVDLGRLGLKQNVLFDFMFVLQNFPKGTKLKSTHPIIECSHNEEEL